MTLRCKLFSHTTAGETTAEKIDGLWWHCCSVCGEPVDKHPMPGQDVELDRSAKRENIPLWALAMWLVAMLVFLPVMVGIAVYHWLREWSK